MWVSSSKDLCGFLIFSRWDPLPQGRRASEKETVEFIQHGKSWGIGVQE